MSYKNNILLMFTVYNLVIVAASASLPAIVEFAKATSLLVFIGWFCVVLTHEYNQIISYFDSTFIKLTGHKLNKNMTTLLDIVVHAGPVLLLGLPMNPTMFAAGFGVVCVWYTMVRSNLHDIYYPVIQKEHVYIRDFMVYGIGSLLTIGLHLFTRL